MSFDILTPPPRLLPLAKLDAEDREAEITSLRARTTALDEDKNALEAELRQLRGTEVPTFFLVAIL